MALTFAMYTISCFEDAIKASFEARRGPLYDALRALDAFSAYEAACACVPDDMDAREIERLVAQAFDRQLEADLNDRFDFPRTYRKAKKTFGDPHGVMDALERLVPEFCDAFVTWEAAGSPPMAARKGPMLWIFGAGESGSFEQTLEYVQESLSNASFSFGEDTPFSDIESRIVVLQRTLPE